MSEFLAAWLPVLPLQAAAKSLPAEPAAVSERNGPLDRVLAVNNAAWNAGVREGMTAPQALGRCQRLHILERSRAAEDRLAARLLEEADHISPRVQAAGPGLALVDFSGLDRLHGSAAAAARRLEASLATDGWTLHTGVAAHPTMALIAARCRLGHIASGGERAALAPLPVSLLAGLGELTREIASGEEIAEMLLLLERWGIRTLGALAGLPRAALAARLGRIGLRLQEMARGSPSGILNTPPQSDWVLDRCFVFDPPCDNLEAVKAVVARESDALSPELERHDRVVERAELLLMLEDKHPTMTYARSFAVPTRDARALASQLHLALERDPPPAPIRELRLRYALALPRRFQMRLFAAATADREKTSKLLARLGELFGPAADRIGSPRRLDTHRPRAFVMHAFAPPEGKEAMDADASERAAGAPRLALRVFRPPRAFALEKASILRRAGPWRSCGGWWRDSGDAERWAWEEWDAEVRFRGHGPSGLYRLGRDPAARCWYLLGQYD